MLDSAVRALCQDAWTNDGAAGSYSADSVFGVVIGYQNERWSAKDAKVPETRIVRIDLK
jgi:hypothetical protein